jgi:hypothetical protein
VDPKKPVPVPKPKTPSADTPLGMIKRNVSPGSAAGLLRDQKSRRDKMIEEAGG